MKSKKAFRLLITGDRYWQDILAVKRVIVSLKKTYPGLLVIAGGAQGADSHARMVCGQLGIPFCEFPAPWDGLGNGAGPARNKWMLKFMNPHLVVWFHKDLTNSKGTKNMIEQAEKVDCACVVRCWKDVK